MATAERFNLAKKKLAYLVVNWHLVKGCSLFRGGGGGGGPVEFFFCLWSWVCGGGVGVGGGGGGGGGSLLRSFILLIM